MLFQSVVVLLFLNVRWGNHHLTFSTNGVFYLAFAIILLITSSVIEQRRSATTTFVQTNWKTIQNFVPQNFADKSWHKYALTCSSLLDQTATIGILCAIFAILFSISALRAAFVAISLGEGGFEALMEENIRHSQSFSKRSLTGYGAVEESRDSVSEKSSDVAVDESPQLSGASRLGKSLGVLDLNKSGMVKRKDSNASFSVSEAFSEPPEPTPDPSELLKDHPMPSVTQWAITSINDLKAMLKEHTKYSIFVFSLLVAAIVAVGVGMGNVGSQLKCHKLVHDPFFTSMNFSAPVTGTVLFSLTHKFPRGTVSFIPAREWPAEEEPLPEDDSFGVIVKQWNTKGAPTFTKEELMKKIFSGSDACSDEDRCHYIFDFSPSAIGNSLDDSQDSCDAIQVSVFYPFDGGIFDATLEMFSHSAFVNVSGPLDLTDIQKSVFKAFHQLTVHTEQSPVLVSNVLVNSLGREEGSNFARNTQIRSQSGDLTMDLVLVQGIQVNTGGDIFVNDLLSGKMDFTSDNPITINGNVTLITGGSGRIVISSLVMAENLETASEKGKILGQNSVSYILFDTDVISESGTVVLNSWLPLSGNLTFIRTKASVSGSFVFANYMDVKSYEGSISFTELFLGLNSPPEGFFPEDMDRFNNTIPGIEATAKKGAISLVGLSAGILGSDSGDDWADDLRIKASSVAGNVKMQVNGGGYNGHYCTYSKFGQSPVEINGRDAPSKGIIDKSSDGTGYANLTTVRGDTQLVVLPSPLGAELF